MFGGKSGGRRGRMDSPCSRIGDLNSMVSHRRLVGYRERERERVGKSERRKVSKTSVGTTVSRLT